MPGIAGAHLARGLARRQPRGEGAERRVEGIVEISRPEPRVPQAPGESDGTRVRQPPMTEAAGGMLQQVQPRRPRAAAPAGA